MFSLFRSQDGQAEQQSILLLNFELLKDFMAQLRNSSSVPLFYTTVLIMSQSPCLWITRKEEISFNQESAQFGGVYSALVVVNLWIGVLKLKFLVPNSHDCFSLWSPDEVLYIGRYSVLRLLSSKKYFLNISEMVFSLSFLPLFLTFFAVY